MRISVFKFRLFILIFFCLQTVIASDHHIKNKPQNSKFYKPVQIDASKLVQDDKVKNVILFIGDGMGVSQIFAGMTANQGSLNLEYLKYIGFTKTQSYDNYITDSGAAATAIACGVKTYNGAIGLDPALRSVPNLIELAELRGMSTGLIATSSITHATPASFIAHQKSRHMHEEIASDFLKTDIDERTDQILSYIDDKCPELVIIGTKKYTLSKYIIEKKALNRIELLKMKLIDNGLDKQKVKTTFRTFTKKLSSDIIKLIISFNILSNTTAS